MSKITKRQRRAQRQLSIQVHRVQVIEDFMIEHIDPVECPTTHYFTDNGDGMDTVCREFRVPAGVIVTGTIYSVEMFWVLMSGSMRLIEGDHTRDIHAPCLLKNVVGIKNAGYAYEDCLFYGFIPNPNNSRDLIDIINSFSAVPAEQLMGMSDNKQQQNYEQRLIQ